MDVDLESSSVDVMEIFNDLRVRAIFSYECMPWNFVDGRVESTRSPDAVLPPILDRYAPAGRTPIGRYLAGNMGVVWDAEAGVPVLSLEARLALRDLALGT